MKKHLILLLWGLLLPLGVQAQQRISVEYSDVSLADALRQLDEQQSDYSIYFLYNELEDFRISVAIQNKRLPDAVKLMVGFYPVRVSTQANKIFVECEQKTSRRYIGTVVGPEGQPVAYANVALLSSQDSSLITGGVTNENGLFVIPCDTLPVLARVSYVGYQTLCHYCPSAAVGKIQLQAQTLQNVVVQGQRSLYQMGEEGLVTRVENTLLSQLGTADDVLKHVPGVIARDGTYEVFGKGTPLIYINGRPIHGIKELEQLKSTEIKSVELITNPGTKYDATVNAVIKIQTLPKAGEGFSMDTWSRWKQGHKDKESVSVDVNYRRNGLDVFGSLWAGRGRYLQKAKITQQVDVDTLWQQRNVMRNDEMDRDCSIESGFNYAPSEKLMLGAKYEVTLPTTGEKTTSLLSDVTVNGAFHDRWKNLTQHHRKNDVGHALNVYYIGKAGALSIDWNLDYLCNGFREQSKISEVCQVQEDRLIDAENRVRNRMLASKLTLSYPLLGGTIDFGTEYVHTDRHDDYLSPQTYVRTTYSTIKQQNVSPFAEYSRKISVGQIRAGVRYEQISFDYYENGNRVAEQSRNSGNLYPFLSFATHMGKVQTQLSYSAKTTRPTYRELSNDVFYGNRYSIQRGNPLLKNSTRHNVSLQGTWRFLQFSLGYTDERDDIIHWMEQTENASVTLVTYRNIPSLKSLTPFLSAAPVVGIWHPQISLGVRKQWLTLETSQGDISLNKPIVMFQWDNTIAFGSSLTGEVNFQYQGKGHYQNIYMDYNTTVLGVAVVKTFLDKRLSLKLAGEDLLDRSRDSNLCYNHQVQLCQGNYYDRRRLVVSVRYTFNVARSKYKGTGAGNEEKGRL